MQSLPGRGDERIKELVDSRIRKMESRDVRVFDKTCVVTPQGR